MADKYDVGRVHVLKEKLKEKRDAFNEEGGLANVLANRCVQAREKLISKLNHGDCDYDHLYRRKTRWELVRLSAAVMGIEFSYAAETAFVSPTLLKIGVEHRHMTLIWCLSPLIGFFLTPIMGSLSDRCRSNLGRRRPFIVLLAIGVVLGLLLVPNGKFIGQRLGDRYPGEEAVLAMDKLHELDEDQQWVQVARSLLRDEQRPGGRLFALGQRDDESRLMQSLLEKEAPASNSSLVSNLGLPLEAHHAEHPWGIFFTILGTVLLDFDADACQSPSRAYLLDVTLPDDHALGLSTFTIMAGLGGSLGYVIGAVDWGPFATLFGGHVRLVFSVVLVIFVACVTSTLTSFAEVPLDVMDASKAQITAKRRKSSHYHRFASMDEPEEQIAMERHDYGATHGNNAVNNAVDKTDKTDANPFRQQQLRRESSVITEEEERRFLQLQETSLNQASPMPLQSEASGAKAHLATVSSYLWSIVVMPWSMRVLCVTNLFCWMSLVCYSLYFTDFVGEAVFGGDPQAPPGSAGRKMYDEGVQFGCWGMAMYSLSCACYSYVIERLVKRLRARVVYIGGQLVYCVGMIMLALIRTKWAVLVFSWSAGVMYSTLFTMPYILVAYYHETDTYSASDMAQSDVEKAASRGSAQPRGLGTDVGIVSSMVFLAQFLLSLSMGSIISYFESTTAVIGAAAILSFCGACSAAFVTYLDL